MTETRLAKIARIAGDIPAQRVEIGDDWGSLAVVGWGSTHGPIYQAVRRVREDGHAVSHIHLRYLNPFPRNLGELLGKFERILVPEMNAGQLATKLRGEYLLPVESLSKVAGKPFKISEIERAIRERL